MPVNAVVGVGSTPSGPKLNTHTVSLPSTEMPQGTVRPPPVNGEPGCGSRVSLRYMVIDGLVAGPSLRLSGHGASSQSELAIQMFPLLSAALPMGWLSSGCAGSALALVSVLRMAPFGAITTTRSEEHT